MSLVKLGRNAIEARRLDSETARKLRQFIDSKPHLDSEEYEMLRRLGRAVKAGEVEQEF